MKKQHSKKTDRSGKRKKSGQAFWDNEYQNSDYLALSTSASEDMMKFTRFLEREYGREQLNPKSSVVDLGCGNGRNLIWLSHQFGMSGTGFDISTQAIIQAKKATATAELPLTYEARSIAGPLPFENESQDFVLDMMVSHFLNEEERAFLLSEIVRILKPGGWLFFKTFLLDEDRHAKRLLQESPATEKGSYIHPEIGVAEHVSTAEEIETLLSPHFTLHKIQKSHGHLRGGKSAKRRSISVYAEKNY